MLNDEGTVIMKESHSGFVFRKEPKFKAMAMDGATPDLLAVEALADGTN
jgi:hypothetical protein